MPSEPSRNPLPFEPNSKRKKAAETAAKPAEKAAKAGSAKPVAAVKTKAKSASRSRSEASIPEVVSQRMFKRMLVFSGLPVLVGVGIFFGSYFLLINQILDFPKYFVLLLTMGCFGLGVAGLSYGALSASWDEDRLGTWFGADEFRVNFGRLTGAWRAARKDSPDADS
jgi:Photosynthesis affected mutant 68